MHNHVPPWILFKNISFGDSINLYNVLKKEQKEMVIDLLFNNANAIKYDQKVEILRNGLNNIRIYRNLAAHNLSFTEFRLKKIYSTQAVISGITRVNLFDSRLVTTITY